jgi:hypothetical protein
VCRGAVDRRGRGFGLLSAWCHLAGG